MSLLPELRRISSQYGFRQSKKLSQHFLIDERVLAREAGYASPKGKSVLEIGPGFGFLTKELAKTNPTSITLIEKDSQLIPILESEFTNHTIKIIHADFLKWKSGAKFDLIISNVPYSISSPLLFHLADLNFSRAILCLQKEFVERMLAKPGSKDYSRLSVTSQASFSVRLLEKVPRSAFHPIPKVDSAIIELIPTGEKLDARTALLIRLLFQHKKKTVRAALSDSAEALGITKEEARKIAEDSGLSGRRVFTLSKEDFANLSSRYLP